MKHRWSGYWVAMHEHAATPVPPGHLSDDELFQQLGSLHRTRDDTLRHGSIQSLRHHDDRQTALETEYLRRYPGREIDPHRLRPAVQT